jgi:signal transduction histidine kinase
MRLSSSRLAFAFVLIFAGGVSALLAAVYLLTARVLEREVDAVISSEAATLLDDYARGGLLSLVTDLQRRADGWGRAGAVYVLVEPNGFPIAGNLARWPVGADERNGWIEFEIDARGYGGVASHPIRAHVFELPGGRRLLIGMDILDRRVLAARLRTAMLWGVGLCVALAALVGAHYSRGVRRRVRAIADACETIIAGDLSQRLPVASVGDEYDALATAVNHMLEALERQTHMLRTTFESAAHDLRAPLYRARVRIEETLQDEQLSLAARDTMDATLAELERVQRVLGTLLQIAQADGRGREATREAVDVAALARELVELYTPEAMERRLTLAYDGDEAAMLRGNRQLLAQALVNLIENALKYVPAEGRVTVKVTRAQEAIELSVADDGPGVPADERSRVLQPFVRLERDRGATGSGLGLSLVAAVVRLHGGDVELRDNHPGLEVACSFPKKEE